MFASIDQQSSAIEHLFNQMIEKLDTLYQRTNMGRGVSGCERSTQSLADGNQIHRGFETASRMQLLI